MRWPPWRKRSVPPVIDPKPAREAAQALEEARQRWSKVHEVVQAHRELRHENHFAERIRNAMGAHE